MQKMKNPVFSVVVKIRNLQSCRTFYAALPGFGEPVMESSFAVVFRPACGMEFVLVKSEAKYLEHGSSATAWSFEVPDLEAFKAVLAKFDLPLETPDFTLGCGAFLRGADPEGNLFYVREAEKL